MPPVENLVENPVENPFTPGLGLEPPVLAGREAAIDAVDGALEALERLDAAVPLVLTGLVGMGRTAALGGIARRSTARRWAVGMATLQPDRFGAALGEAIETAVGSLAARRPGGAAPTQLRGALAGYRAALEERSDAVVATAVRRLFKAAGTTLAGVGWGLCLLLDDLQHATTQELEALVEAGCDAADRGWAIALVGAGLPSIEPRLDAGLSATITLGPLDDRAVVDAVAGPLDEIHTGDGAGIDTDATSAIGALAGGCPLLVQAYAAAAWDAAGGGRIGLPHVEAGRGRAEQDLERWFFAGALAGLAPHERRYLRAMADLGDDGVPADALARRLGDNGRPGGVGSRVAGVRARLERIGLIHSVGGDRLDFSLPLLGGYLRSRG